MKHRSTPTSSITFTLPGIFGSAGSSLKENFSRPLARLRMRFPNGNFKNIFPKILLVLAVLGVIVGAFFFMSKPASQADTRIQIEKAKASQTVNREFTFPLKDDKGTVVTTIKYTVEAAELHNEIVVKGQRASSVKGRTFLIIPIKIINGYNQAIEIQSKDYIRLVVNDKEVEQLAADIHNDPVTVQALSTKQTRIGFPINDSDKNLSLRVGELNGQKETIALTLK